MNFLLPHTRAENRSRSIARVVGALENLPHNKTWRVTVKEGKPERSMAQNRYLFGVAYPLISEVTGYEKDDLHTYLLGQHFGWKLKRVPKTKRNREGLVEVPVRTTTTDGEGRRSVLGKIEFAEFVAFVQRTGAKAGVHIPDPEETYERAA